MKQILYSYSFWYKIICTGIVIFSFLVFSPIFLSNYNSDNAIHVLMANDFELPRDYYFWGQNRLGSFLPLITSLFLKIIPIPAIYGISIVQYSTLIIAFLILARYLKHYTLKIVLCGLIFLPVSDYYFLTLIAHPYGTQLFLGALFIFCADLFYKNFIKHEALKYNYFKLIIFSCLSILILSISIWVSEFSGLLLLLPILICVFNKPLQAVIIQNLKQVKMYLLIIVNVLLGVTTLSFYKYTKKTVLSVADESYDKLFTTDWSQIYHNLMLIAERTLNTLSFGDNKLIENIFYWILLLASIIMIIGFKLKSKNGLKRQLVFSLLIMLIIGSIALVLSSYMVKNNIEPKYFTPLYILFGYMLLFSFDYSSFYKKVRFSLCLGILICGIFYAFSFSTKGTKPIEKYADFKQLPKGVIFSDYWGCFLPASISPDSLIGVPYENQTVRNFNWIDKCLNQENFYFTKSYAPPGGLNSIVYQFGYAFYYTGKTYSLSHDTLLLYKRIGQKINQFRLKACNQKYVACNKDGSFYFTSKKDDINTLFQLEVTRQGLGIQSNNNKYWTNKLNLSPSKIISSSKNIYDWERFYLMSMHSSEYDKIAILNKDNHLVVSADTNTAQLRCDQKTIQDCSVFTWEFIP